MVPPMFVCPECGATLPTAGHCPADGTALAARGEDVLLGTTIGVYRVARLLGIGGMGRVYKGVHPTIGSRVAIKVLSRECSDRRDLVDRFFAEAKAVNLIRHESIVNVLDLATLPDGRPYIIMEYLDGAPLASLIDYGIEHQAALPLGGIARLAAEVLDALGAAHAKGIVHRDLKPDNVFVAPSGRPKVLDFGIAKLTDVNNASTRTGSLLGTPHYMSPEQAAGRAVDHRADLYAMGVILFECATGQKPFLAEALFDLLRMHVEAPPPSPRALRPDMPPELERVILTALAKAPDQRFASANAMSLALQHATAQLAPEQWRPLTPPNVRSATGGNWAPTPPASWSGHGSQPPRNATATTPSAHPPDLGHVPTVSAGQVTRGSAPSRRGLWFALIGALVIGGGIVGAVVAGGGGRKDVEATTTAPEPAKPEPAKPEPAKPEPAKPEPARPAQAAADDEDDKPDPAAPAIDEALAQLDDVIKGLPADQQKQLAAYKDLAKLPARERAKRLRELTRKAGVAPDPSALAQALEASDDEPAPAPGAWVHSHSIDSPPGFDPARLDVTAFIPWAVAQARRLIPDAQLIRIDTNGVSPDGRANLTLPSLASEHGSIDVRFISPSRGKRDPSQPLGVARHDFKCEFRIMATPEGVEVMPIDFADCSKERVVPVPKCSFAGVWKKAINRKAPSQNAVGNVDYRSNGARPVWYFAIGAGFDVAFSQTFDDGCSP
jgi:serine/threonine-protein kinase